MNNWLNAKVIAAIPIFIAVNIAAISVWAFNISQQSMPLILGIIAGGLVDLDNRLTGRLKKCLLYIDSFLYFILYCPIKYRKANTIYCLDDCTYIYFYYDRCCWATL